MKTEVWNMSSRFNHVLEKALVTRTTVVRVYIWLGLGHVVSYIRSRVPCLA